MEKLELISHPLCPFNQRLILTLLLKGKKRNEDFFVKYLDLANLPPWFNSISPTGEMPVLKINEETVLFKTNPINEYLNEYSSGNLHSEDSLEKAIDRSWIEYSDNILYTLRDVFTSTDHGLFNKYIEKLFGFFEAIEEHLDLKSKYWRNQHYTLVDGAFIPVFTLMLHFDYFKNHPYWKSFPKTVYYANNLMETPMALESKCPDFSLEFDHFFNFTQSSFEELIKN
jgi:glutathione S-transferase